MIGFMRQESIWKIEDKRLWILVYNCDKRWMPLSFEPSDGTFNLTEMLLVLVRAK
jgi:hypothetical protein